MSDQLPTEGQAGQAYAFMRDQIHVPAFLEKLAANGIQPKTEAEAQQLVQMGAVLAEAEASGQTKQAQDGNPFLSHILNRLQPKQEVDVDAFVKQNADKLVQEHAVAKTAALVYGHAASGGELAPDEPEETPAE